MTMMTSLRGSSALGRGLVAVRAEAQAKKPATIDDLGVAFEAFKTAHTQQLDEIKAGKTDVITAEKLGTINAALDKLEAALNAQATQIAAAKLGDLGDGKKPADPVYSGAFNAYVRKNDIQAAMSVGSNPDGGYTAPVEWDRSIADKMKLISPIRQYATVEPVGTAGFTRLYNDRNVGSGWVGETAARPATTTPQLSPLSFANGEIYANPQVTQQLLDDSVVDVEAWLQREVSTEFDRQEAIAFLSGNGTNKPIGILNYLTGGANAATHPWGAITVINSGAAAAFTSDGIVNLTMDLPSMYAGNARFFGNRASLGKLRLLKDGQGNYIWQPSFQAGQPSTLAGYDFVDLPDMPNVAAGAIPLLFGDMAETYLILDRMGVRVIRDALTNKPYIGFYTTKRVGGGVKNPMAMRGQMIAAAS